MAEHLLESAIARVFSMSNGAWERHANSLSVWTRFTALPILILAIWSREWIGPWAWIVTALALAWTWLNPRIFSKPVSTDNWASKAVLGGRVWINRKQPPVPRHQSLAPNLLSGISALGSPFLFWGVAVGHLANPA